MMEFLFFIEGVDPLRVEIRRHFETHFKDGDGGRSCLGNMNFLVLGQTGNNFLMAPFSVDEIKSAFWDCGSYKSPGPDGVSFSFIKQFWTEIKYDFIGFLEEFHENGKLARGSNCSFIVLILKKDNPSKVSDF